MGFLLKVSSCRPVHEHPDAKFHWCLGGCVGLFVRSDFTGELAKWKATVEVMEKQVAPCELARWRAWTSAKLFIIKFAGEARRHT